MGQLEPGAGEDFLEIGRIITEALSDLAVGGIELHCHVGVGHDRLLADRWVFDVDRHVFFGDVDRFPLVRAGGRLLQPPVVTEQQVEVAALAGVPFHRMRRPRAFDTARHRVAADAARGVVLPAEALFFQFSALGGRAEVGGATVAVRLADRVAAACQGNGFLVVHGHAGKGDAYIVGCLQRVGFAVHAFRVNVDEAHHHGSQRIFQITFAGVAAACAAAGGEPFLFRAPVGVLFGMPDVFAPERKTEGFQSHRFVGHIPREDDQVGPGKLVAVFLLDRPEQATGLVEVGVVRPRIKRRETLVAGAATTTTIGDAIGACRVPGHADHQAAVVAPVSRPPGLAVGHQRLEILLECFDVEFLDLFPIVETSTHWVGLAVVLMQNVQTEGLRPPVHVRHAGRCRAAVHHRTLPWRCVACFVCHLILPS